VAIKDLTSPKVLAHLLKYDSAQGRFEPGCKSDRKKFVRRQREEVKISHIRTFRIPWKEHARRRRARMHRLFTDKTRAEVHLTAALVKWSSQPRHGDLERPSFFNVNHDILDGSETVISCASCTTIAWPMAKTLNDNTASSPV